MTLLFHHISLSHHAITGTTSVDKDGWKSKDWLYKHHDVKMDKLDWTVLYV